jgi:hypothetical protein
VYGAACCEAPCDIHFSNNLKEIVEDALEELLQVWDERFAATWISCPAQDDVIEGVLRHMTDP